MGKPDLSVSLRLTPRQAVAILSAIEYYQRAGASSTRWRSAMAGARYWVRNALIDAKWEPEAKGVWFKPRA